jgi:uncharacterized protein YggE
MKRTILALAITALPLAAGAQTPPAAATPDGIRVTGVGTATGQVDTAIVRLGVRGFDDPSDLVAGLRSAGVPDATIERTADGWLLHGHAGLSRTTISAVSRLADTFDKTHQQMGISELSFYGLASDCPVIERRARAAALDDARRRAEEIAAASSAHAGAPTAVVESGGCQRPGPYGGVFPIDPLTLTMRVSVLEAVTFAIAR